MKYFLFIILSLIILNGCGSEDNTPTTTVTVTYIEPTTTTSALKGLGDLDTLNKDLDMDELKNIGSELDDVNW